MGSSSAAARPPCALHAETSCSIRTSGTAGVLPQPVGQHVVQPDRSLVVDQGDLVASGLARVGFCRSEPD
jgi:hypothetical protein